MPTVETKVGIDNAGKLLPSSSREYKMINQIAERVIDAVRQQNGGGFQKHVDRFSWEVVVVDDKVPNAFVLPGGKIVVFTGECSAEGVRNTACQASSARLQDSAFALSIHWALLDVVRAYCCLVLGLQEALS